MKIDSCLVLLCLISLIISGGSLRAESKALGQVLTVKGTASLDGKKLSVGDHLVNTGLLSTEEGSVLRLYLTSPKGIVTMGPSSKLRLEAGASDPEKTKKGEAPEAVASMSRLVHLEGLVRLILKKTASSSPKEQKGKGELYPLYTPNSSMGIRGTDFMVISNSLLQETELVVFDGKVTFKSRLSPEEKVVPAGYWGGLGGRFTERIGKLIKLPENVIKIFKEKGQVETGLKETHEDSELYGEKIPNEL